MNHQRFATIDSLPRKCSKFFLITRAERLGQPLKKITVDSLQRMGHSHGQALAVGRSVNALGFFGVG